MGTFAREKTCANTLKWEWPQIVLYQLKSISKLQIFFTYVNELFS